MNFPGRADRQLVWVEPLLYQGIEMKLRALQYQPAQGEDAGRPAAHKQRTGKLSSGDAMGSGAWLSLHPSYDLITNY